MPRTLTVWAIERFGKNPKFLSVIDRILFKANFPIAAFYQNCCLGLVKAEALVWDKKYEEAVESAMEAARAAKEAMAEGYIFGHFLSDNQKTTLRLACLAILVRTYYMLKVIDGKGWKNELGVSLIFTDQHKAIKEFKTIMNSNGAFTVPEKWALLHWNELFAFDNNNVSQIFEIIDMKRKILDEAQGEFERLGKKERAAIVNNIQFSFKRAETMIISQFKGKNGTGQEKIDLFRNLGRLYFAHYQMAMSDRKNQDFADALIMLKKALSCYEVCAYIHETFSLGNGWEETSNLLRKCYICLTNGIINELDPPIVDEIKERIQLLFDRSKLVKRFATRAKSNFIGLIDDRFLDHRVLNERLC